MTGGNARHTILCADDFAMTDGVTRAIETLAEAGRLSATSAFVTTPHWQAHAARLARLAPRLSIGLHFNLTLGAPLGPMPEFAPVGRLPPLGAIAKAGFRRRISADEIAGEARRQLAAFEDALGRPPDHVDGHQHVHALPGVRGPLIAVLAERYPGAKPLVRVSGDSLTRIAGRRVSALKAAVITGFAAGLRRRLCRLGFPTNDSFSGVSAFDRASDFRRELDAFLKAPGRCHLVMCHPGHVDPELATLDSVVDRRQDEFDALMADAALVAKLWHPERDAGGRIVNWPDCAGGARDA